MENWFGSRPDGRSLYVDNVAGDDLTVAELFVLGWTDADLGSMHWTVVFLYHRGETAESV